MTKDDLYPIGVLAEKAKVNIQTIRFYERKKLLLPKSRKDSKQTRYYDQESLDALFFIRNSQELGFQLEEIRELLRLRTVEKGNCPNVRKIALAKLNNVKAKINELKMIELKLLNLVTVCDLSDEDGPCPIINSIDHRSDCCDHS